MASADSQRLPALRVHAMGPSTEDGALPVDRLNTLSRNLQTAVQSATKQLALADSEPVTAPAMRSASQLAIVSVRPGSVVIDFDFAAEVEPRLQELRSAAAVAVVRGIRELSEHSYLPSAWSPEALLAVRRIVRMLNHGIYGLVLETPRFLEGLSAQLDREIEPRLTLLLERYEQRVEAPGATYSLGKPPPRKRRKAPALPLFESGRPELAREIDEIFRAKDDER